MAIFKFVQRLPGDQHRHDHRLARARRHLQGEAWKPFRQAASHFKEILLIVPAGEGSEPVYPAAFGLDNVLVVEHGAATADALGFAGRMQRLSGAALAVAAAGKAAAAMLAREPRLDAGALKRRLIEADADPMWRARK